MTKRYILTPQADSDLEEIFLYTIKKWGMSQAEKYLLELDEAMIKLAEGEVSGKNCEMLLPEKGKGLQYYHVNKHYVIYRNYHDGIEVITLYHDRMDLPYHLERLAEASDS